MCLLASNRLCPPSKSVLKVAAVFWPQNWSQKYEGRQSAFTLLGPVFWPENGRYFKATFLLNRPFGSCGFSFYKKQLRIGWLLKNIWEVFQRIKCLSETRADKCIGGLFKRGPENALNYSLDSVLDAGWVWGFRGRAGMWF